MTSLLCTAAFLTLIAAPAPPPPPAPPPSRPDKPACTAKIEIGKKYHWVTFQNGVVQKSGYVMYTNKKHGAWTKVEHFTDRPKAKVNFWGQFDDTKVNFKNTELGERWTAWMKFCEGPKLIGNITKNDQIILQFHIDTSRVRD